MPSLPDRDVVQELGALDLYLVDFAGGHVEPMISSISSPQRPSKRSPLVRSSRPHVAFTWPAVRSQPFRAFRPLRPWPHSGVDRRPPDSVRKCGRAVTVSRPLLPE